LSSWRRFLWFCCLRCCHLNSGSRRGRCSHSWYSQAGFAGGTLDGLPSKFFRDVQALITTGTRYFHFELSLKPRHTPPAPRLRLLLVVFSFPFSFQFFTRRCLKNQFLVCPWLNKMTLLLSNVLHLL